MEWKLNQSWMNAKTPRFRFRRAAVPVLYYCCFPNGRLLRMKGQPATGTAPLRHAGEPSGDGGATMRRIALLLIWLTCGSFGALAQFCLKDSDCSQSSDKCRPTQCIANTCQVAPVICNDLNN